eukprot:m.35590 g.35590  ORF g.35590 m.35590 type:complete len:549 (-) comp9602_c0_seq2:183-1829(-)
MSFMQEVKYRGCVPVVGFTPTHAQPRPGMIEASLSLKRLLSQEKRSTVCVLSISSEMGLKCVDTSLNPPKVIMSNSINELVHCGVDATRLELVSIIVGAKMGADTQFYFHVFKCPNKEMANRVARAVANACTLAHQSRLDQQRYHGPPHGAAPPPAAMGPPPAGSPPGPAPASNFSRGHPGGADPRQNFQKSVKASVQRQTVRGAPLVPKLTDAWFRPSMGRTEVNSILRDARVGDFIVRESQSQAGDYALAVQTGGFIWTGLLTQTPNGFRVGKTGHIEFPEITDFVAYYMQNDFIPDSNGNPIQLRLPGDLSANPPQRRSTFKNPPVSADEEPSAAQRELSGPTFRNPPSFDALDDDVETEEPPAGGEGFAPACGWPDSDGEEDASDFLSKGKDSLVDEQAAFEMIMNGTHDEHGAAVNSGTVNLADMDRALAEMEGELAGQSPAADEDASSSELQKFAKRLWAEVTLTPEGLLHGKDARPVLMRSGLDTQTLGVIWMEIDVEQQGQIDFEQFTLMLGLVSQAQFGQQVDVSTLDPTTIPPPQMKA